MKVSLRAASLKEVETKLKNFHDGCIFIDDFVLLQELDQNQKPVAIQFTSEYYKISVSNVYKIIVFME